MKRWLPQNISGAGGTNSLSASLNAIHRCERSFNRSGVYWTQFAVRLSPCDKHITFSSAKNDNNSRRAGFGCVHFIMQGWRCGHERRLQVLCRVSECALVRALVSRSVLHLCCASRQRRLFQGLLGSVRGSNRKRTCQVETGGKTHTVPDGSLHWH
jgi:hypothetical protein